MPEDVPKPPARERHDAAVAELDWISMDMKHTASAFRETGNYPMAEKLRTWADRVRSEAFAAGDAFGEESDSRTRAILASEGIAAAMLAGLKLGRESAAAEEEGHVDTVVS